MIKWEDYLADKEHYQDLRREAERQHSVQYSGEKNSLYNRARQWLGDHLVVWGQRLQNH